MAITTPPARPWSLNYRIYHKPHRTVGSHLNREKSAYLDHFYSCFLTVKMYSVTRLCFDVSSILSDRLLHPDRVTSPSALAADFRVSARIRNAVISIPSRSTLIRISAIFFFLRTGKEREPKQRGRFRSVHPWAKNATDVVWHVWRADAPLSSGLIYSSPSVSSVVLGRESAVAS